jgi:hypothetical protein
VGIVPSLDEKRSFIESQLAEFHPALAKIRYYNDSIDDLFEKIFQRRPTVKTTLTSNYRDSIYHYRRFRNAIQNDTDLNACIQYEMVFEHLNRGIIDVYVDMLNKIYHLHHRISFELKSALKKNQETPFMSQNDCKYARIRVYYTRHGYLKAREALSLFRAKKPLVGNPISAYFDFKNELDYMAHVAYYQKIYRLFSESYKLLRMCK